MNAPIGFTSIESIDTKKICNQDLNKILEVERDMWAREDGLGEYVKCNNCESILSKEDMFGEFSKEIQNETVTKIENILCLDSIICPTCQSTQTEFIFGDEYVEEIVDRFKNSESYLVVYRDQNREIRGFMDGYIDDFHTIFKREFSKYYNSIGKEKIIELIEKAIDRELPKYFLLCSSLGMEKLYINFLVIINLLKAFLGSIDNIDRDILGLFEARIKSSVYCLNLSLGAIPIGANNLNTNNAGNNHNDNIDSDILLTGNSVKDYRDSLSINNRELIKKIKNQIKSVKK